MKTSKKPKTKHSFPVATARTRSKSNRSSSKHRHSHARARCPHARYNFWPRRALHWLATPWATLGMAESTPRHGNTAPGRLLSALPGTWVWVKTDQSLRVSDPAAYRAAGGQVLLARNFDPHAEVPGADLHVGGVGYTTRASLGAAQGASPGIAGGSGSVFVKRRISAATKVGDGVAGVALRQGLAEPEVLSAVREQALAHRDGLLVYWESSGGRYSIYELGASRLNRGGATKNELWELVVR